MGEWAEVTAAVVAVIILLAGLIKIGYTVARSLTMHGLRLDMVEGDHVEHARILERVVVQLARVEERTKRM